ncbi:MAG: hypothetical protein LAO21_10640 [Acidobacteriia bacterium]|nr:hypothetical protein [Terriglobia bacterium]
MQGDDIPWEPTHVDVDGTLANPHMLLAVVLVAILLSILTVAVVVRILRVSQGRKLPRLSLVGYGIVFPVLYLLAITPIPYYFFALVFQTIHYRHYVSTGWWGLPPAWIAPSIGLVAGFTAFIVIRTRKVNSTA